MKEREREKERENGAAAAGKDASLPSKYSPPPRYVKLTGITDLHEGLVEGFNRTPAVIRHINRGEMTRSDRVHRQVCNLGYSLCTHFKSHIFCFIYFFFLRELSCRCAGVPRSVNRQGPIGNNVSSERKTSGSERASLDMCCRLLHARKKAKEQLRT